MTKMILVAILLLASVAPALGQSRDPRLEWTLTLEDGANILLASWSSNASCMAVATETTVHVVSASGQPLWKWNFHETNRLIHVRSFTGTLALAPTCDSLILGGDSDYKYVWAANQRGQHTFLATDGTPLAAKFNLRGDTVALVTGGPSGYLLSPRLAIRWHGELGDLPIRWPSQAVNNGSSPRPEMEFTRGDVDQLFSALRWGYGVSDSVSDDGEWRVVTVGTFRGPRTTTIELDGPGADGYRARHLGAVPHPPSTRWIKPMGCPGAELTRDGRFVIATGDPDHPDAYAVGDSPDCDSGNLSTYFFDRDGNLVLTWPHDGDRAGMAAAFLARTGVPLALQTNSEWGDDSGWGVPPSADEPHDALYAVAYSPDQRRALAGRHNELRVFSAPELPLSAR